MSTLFNKAILAIFSLSIFLPSCGQKIPHSEALNYCVTIQQQMSDAKKSLESSWNELTKQIKVAKQNPNQKLDPTSIDTLRIHYSQTMKRLDNNIKIVSAIRETDAQLGFKEKTLACLSQIKTLQETAMPQMFGLLQNGLNTLTDQQKEENKKIPLLRQDIQTKNAESQSAYLEYLKKYEIKDEELKPFNLTN